jgi:hypothetical protein
MQTGQVSQDGGLQHHLSPHHGEPAEQDSDDGNQLMSADENDNEEEQESPGAPRNGKRKRPISVS